MRSVSRPRPAQFAARLAAPAVAMALAFALSGCLFGNSPDKLNKRIESGEAAKALTVIEEKLTSEPSDPALNLLAIKARLALCHLRTCTSEAPGSIPPILANLGRLAAYVQGPVQLTEEAPPITLQGVFVQAMQNYQSLQPQPAAVVALYRATPVQFQPAVASGLFQPALTLARTGDTTSAAAVLTQLGSTENLPPSYGYAAGAMAATFTGQTQQRETNLIALRSAADPIPPAAAALTPWVILHRLSVSGTLPADALGMLPTELDTVKLTAVFTS
ncbi:MAG: hypothetical protein EON60_09250, partial [Alphaproteobacteria bacterium]